MWLPQILGLPTLLGLAAQVPLQHQQSLPPSPSTPRSNHTMASSYKIDFNFKEGPDVFSPKDMLELPRPGAGVANPAGDLVLVSVSKYSFKDKKNKKSIWLAPTESSVQPFEIPLAKGGEAFWLDTRTVAHAVSEGEGKDEVTALYALNVNYEAESISLLPGPPALIGKFPTNTVTNFKYQAKAGILVFSDNVYEDGDITTVKEQDEAWENRGNTAFVFDETYERHWDTWTGPKRSTLFSVKLTVDPDHKWHLGDKFTNLLHGTGHNCPVEPFGGTDDFDVSETHVLYTAKDPKLPAAWHTKQDIHIVSIDGSSKPRELTSGKQGATHAPTFTPQGDKAAWLELDNDGHESDRHKIVIHDLKKDVQYTLTQKFDRSPTQLSFSPKGDVVYFVAADLGRVKVFALPIPETPSSSTTHPEFAPQYDTPSAITHTGAASGVQALSNGRVLFTRSSLTSPNDVYIISNTDSVNFHTSSPTEIAAQIEKHVKIEQLTKFSAADLKGKSLSEGEEFYFEGAEGKKVQGWVNTPPGFKKGDKKKWPVILLIHGGPEGAWADQWSTRWNPNVWAQQGYVIIAINPTGSTGFGQEFTNAIRKDWGGKPFVDLKAGWKYALENYPEIDADRAVAAGASYGGFAINWIQGHPEFGFGFKALVCHDGTFDTRFTGFATDELFFANYEFGGRPWDKEAKDIYKNNNPLEFVDNWSTPQLLIHGSKDYRLVEAEGLAAFHALQQKGVPSRLVIFPDENHWVLNHGNSLKWHYEVFRWIHKYVGKNE
ncbi:alpha/beta-hydrolase [Cristinia sonorae]|uniref:Dipeptidyl-peptidase V n=1 Tax=Cristinia sonorae TaxID=1940300 RepID=A0A8K0UVM2_9AGAR|nr:alpha/beta-hydrolase [Cristinia sonorae]